MYTRGREARQTAQMRFPEHAFWPLHEPHEESQNLCSFHGPKANNRKVTSSDKVTIDD
jgi:hypothetical protein